ncbi:winged helix-turn-helix domain-containing protein [Granulicella sibirica]|uniref:Signal transduction response regulator / Disease resistance domain-containing protein / Tetratricopeptide repeat-containing protein n=1 Tax=Granulicella sibirica TaxID=2479048 RepID=A0A4Q0SV81_9BACT|nr:winged helix-turn-helix domain-containing protein [Granulicella sibirica]RXH54667.1 Signal transduction response regulator / Disease resistance domain-containing protein / Tetratricopeptide repeat-containing protein [Granulicella sibirica]
MEKLGFYQFDDFLIDPVRRQLCRAGIPVPVPQKAFQLLLYLVTNPRRLLTKRELMSAVWPKSFVEEANLTQSIFLLRKALSEQPGQARYIVTVPGEGYQFAANPVFTEVADSLPVSAQAESRPSVDESAAAFPGGAAVQNAVWEVVGRSTHPQRILLAVGIALLFSAAASLCIWYLRQKPKPTLLGNVVLATFENSTGDPAFDAALNQGLSAELEQSPNLGVISDARIAQTMKLMARPAQASLTPNLARQVCERTGSAALIEGSVAKLGSQYVLGLRALQCRTGDVLAQDQETADSKEHVLRALGIAAGKLRRRLGESLPSLQKYDAPPQDITTGSLDALEAYGLGIQAQVRGDCLPAIAFFKKAIADDPEFAMAYSHLGVCDSSQEGVDATRRAYDLRGRVSDRERLYLESHYEQYATGNLSAARKILETWSETYPHDGDPGPNLLKLYLTTGEYERALPLVETIVKNSPGTPTGNAARLATTLMFLNRTEEAKAVLMDALAHHVDSPVHHYYLYEIYFLQNDSAAMASEASYVRSQPGWDGNMLELESVTASYFGKFALARSLNNQAVQAVMREQNSEDAAGYLGEAALQEALAGNSIVAQQKAKAALALSNSSGVESLAGMADALAGDRVEGQHIAEDMSKRYPTDTLAQIAAATINACGLLGKGKSHEEARRAVEALAPASPYMMSGNLSMVPLYTLGQAYLASGQTNEAAAAFRTILDHRGVTRNYIVGPLARLSLAKAEEQAGDLSKARDDYNEFHRIWRDADIPLTSASLVEGPVSAEALAPVRRMRGLRGSPRAE